MPKPPLIRYAIYTRQSKQGTADFSSCDAQFHTCREYARQSGEYSLHWTGQHFEDEGYSGSTLDRPGMRRLRKVIDLGALDRVYAVAFDRITRNMYDAVVLLDEFEKAGVELCLVHQPELTSAPQNRFLRYMLAAFAEFEREMIASRIAETRTYLKKHGRRLAGPPPYGYDADPATKQLVPNKTEARRVRAIFKRAANGQPPSEISKRIDHLGWRTKRQATRKNGHTVEGGRWTARQVITLLHNPVYLGEFADGNQTRPGCHKPLVSPELFAAAHQELEKRRTTTESQRQKWCFPLRGKITCPKCKRTLSTYIITKKHGPQTKRILRYYRCRSTAGGRPPCKGVSYPAWELENYVRQELAEEATWQKLATSPESEPIAQSMAAIWRSFDEIKQDQMLPQVVQQIEFNRKNTVIKITFSNNIVTAITCGKTTT